MAEPELCTFHLTELRIPLRAPFATSQGEITHRSTVLVEASDGGVSGWGEAAPYPGQDEPLASLWDSTLRRSPTPTLAAAIDEAVCDREARMRGAPLLAGSAESLPVSVAVGITDAHQRVDELVAGGVGAFKIKIAPGYTRHVRAIRDAHPDIVLGVDGNRSFDPTGSPELHDLGACRLTYAEELFSSWTGAGPESVAAAGIPHFADESVRGLDDVGRLIRLGTVGGVTVKPGRLGWTGSLEAIRLVRAADKPWRASGLLETGVGRAFTDLLASVSDAFPSDVAPATAFLVDDVLPDRSDSGRVAIPHGPGIGPEPDRAVIDRYAFRRESMTLPVSAVD